MNFKMCGGLFSFCFLHETVFGNGQVAITHNGERLGVCYFALQILQALDKIYRQNNSTKPMLVAGAVN